MLEDNNKNNDNKWDFSDYAFTITGIIVAVLLVVPEILEAQFGISILGGSLDGLEYDGHNMWSIFWLRALSPLLFLATTTIVLFKEAFDVRRDGSYTGSMFTHTFESMLESAIYMGITTIMVYGAVLAGVMYISWLAGPITWILFIFIFPLVRKKSRDIKNADFPWLLLLVFAIGVIAEVITGAWVAFPLTWLIICVIKLVDTVRAKNSSINTVFDAIYYAFSIILMAVGISLDFWMASWAAFPIALFICWVLKKFKRHEIAEE